MPTLLGLLMLVLALPAPAQEKSIYRCTDGNGRVLYADLPCEGGVALDLPAWKSDAAALERLRLEQEGFERRQATRRERENSEPVYAPSYPWFYAPMYQPPLPRRPVLTRPEPRSYVPAC